jgi:protein TonB
MTDDELSAILKKWQVAPAPPTLEARVFSRRPRPAQSRWRWAALWAAAAVVIGLGLWALRDRRTGETPAAPPGQPHAADSQKGEVAGPRVTVPGRGREAGVPPVRIPPEAAAGKLLEAPPPVYPPAAQAAGVEGTVKLQIVIGKDGRVAETMVISGDQRLAPAAIEAVNRRVYRSTLLNGEPVELVTEVELSFKLNGK